MRSLSAAIFAEFACRAPPTNHQRHRRVGRPFFEVQRVVVRNASEGPGRVEARDLDSVIACLGHHVVLEGLDRTQERREVPSLVKWRDEKHDRRCRVHVRCCGQVARAIDGGGVEGLLIIRQSLQREIAPDASRDLRANGHKLTTAIQSAQAAVARRRRLRPSRVFHLPVQL